jgi:hypothetical protein
VRRRWVISCTGLGHLSGLIISPRGGIRPGDSADGFGCLDRAALHRPK